MLLNEILDNEEYVGQEEFLDLDIDELTEDELDEALRRGFAVRGGKKIRVSVKKKRAGKMSPKQKRALKKNRRKAHRSGAKRKRKKSVRIRGRKNVKSIKGGNKSVSRTSNR